MLVEFSPLSLGLKKGSEALAKCNTLASVFIYPCLTPCFWQQHPPCRCCSVSQSCPILCDPRHCSTPGFPDLRHLPEFAQLPVHWVGNAPRSVLLGDLKDVLLLQGQKLRIGSCSARTCKKSTARQPLGTWEGRDMNEETQPARISCGFVTLVPEPWELHPEWQIGSHLLKRHRCFYDFQSKPRT